MYIEYFYGLITSFRISGAAMLKVGSSKYFEFLFLWILEGTPTLKIDDNYHDNLTSTVDHIQ